MKWKPADVIAIILILSFVALKCLGHDDMISKALLGVVLCYYGIDMTPWVKLGRRQKPKTGGDE